MRLILDTNQIDPKRRYHKLNMALPLYARDGDVILTAEKKIIRVMKLVDPGSLVRVTSWNEWVASR